MVEHKFEYLQQETKCIFCNINYPHNFEKFINYYDYKTKKLLTHLMCYKCLNLQSKCKNCKCDLNTEPYDEIYIYGIDDKFICICSFCIIKPDLPLVSLLWEDVEIKIVFSK